MFRYGRYLYIALGALSTLIPQMAISDEISLVADPWCPYNCVPGSNAPGILIEIAQRAFKNTDHKLQYINMPWQRAIRTVEIGRYHGIVGTGLKETPGFIFSETPIATVQHTFYVKKNDPWKFKNIKSLANRTVGVIRGYSYGDFEQKYIRKYSRDGHRLLIVSGAKPLNRLMKLLIKGRIDTLIEDRVVFQYMMRSTETRHTIKSAGIYMSEDIYIAFSPQKKTSRHYAKILDDYIVTKGDSVVADIFSKYGQ